MSKIEQLECVIVQVAFKVWRKQSGTHDHWKSISPIAKSQMRAIGKEVMAELKPYLDL